MKLLILTNSGSRLIGFIRFSLESMVPRKMRKGAWPWNKTQAGGWKEVFDSEMEVINGRKLEVTRSGTLNPANLKPIWQDPGYVHLQATVES